MRRSARYFGLVVPVLALWACATNPGPGDSGYPFNLSGLAPLPSSLTLHPPLSRIRSRFSDWIMIPFRRQYGGVG
jgi:hypothetical protein